MAAVRPRHRAEAQLRIESSLVLIPVVATDINGRFVPGIRVEDFELRDNGKLQRISSLAVEDGPLTLCIVLDVSMSMKKALPYATEAVRKLVAHSSLEDEFILITVRSQPSVALARTDDAHGVVAAAEHAEPGGDTALYDALVVALNEIRHARHGRRAIAVISDGGDNHSRYTASELLGTVREMDAAVYPIHLTDWSEQSWATEQVLKDIARESGGRYFRAKRMADFPRVANSLDVRRHYVLAYLSSQNEWDGKYRKIDLKIPSAPRNHNFIHISWRRGYYTPSR